MMMMSMDTDVLMGSSPTRYTMEEPQVLWQSSQVVNIRAMVQKAGMYSHVLPRRG